MLLMATWLLVCLLAVVLVVGLTLAEFRLYRRERRPPKMSLAQILYLRRERRRAELAPLESGSARDAVREAIERRR
jgi:hypothetical protein